VTNSESEPEAPQPFEITEREAADLRAAGRWARLAAAAGTVPLALLAFLLVDVGVQNRDALVGAYANSFSTLASNVVSAVGCVGGVALLWAFGRNVAAFFVRDDVALTRAFRRVRQFLIVWTCVVALTSVLGLAAALSMRPLAGI
jgi:hypothetical protein